MSFNVGKTYNFITLVPEVLGGRFENMKVRGKFSWEEAYKYRDIKVLHEQIKRSLPQNIRIEDMEYILFEDSNKKTIVIPTAYIESDSIVEVRKLTLLVEIPNCNTEDAPLIQEKLVEIGKVGCTIKLKYE